MTSADPAEAALDKNIMLGLVVRDRALAAPTSLHFPTLIEEELLSLLPLAEA